ncbi:hypothetical protein ACWDV4_23155, partial [Micromonospora sp. NPDC003197]
GEPRRNAGGRWELALSPIVAALAAEVGAAEFWDAYDARRPATGESILLPTDWRPDLPVADRWRWEGQAIARHSWHPWRLWFGRVEPAPARNLDAELGWLCHLADLCCLDLVVEVRRVRYGRLNWDIRYELPDAGVPVGQRGWADDLPAAVAATTVAEAMLGLADRSLTAPAHYLRPHRLDRSGLPTVDLDQVERRVHADLDGLAGPAVGAQAIWRDGRWQHTRLCPGDVTEVLREQSTGQVVRETVTALSRAWEQPAPSWQGEPIPYDVCPDCAPEHRLRRCLCTLGDRSPDPDCPGCQGLGVAAESGPCHTCRGSRRVYRGAVVTLTDEAEGILHLNWLPPARPAAAPQVATQPGGKPVCQLPRHYQLRHWAAVLQARPVDLTNLDGGQPVGQDLRDGIVTVDHLGVDPYVQYIADASARQPAGRVLISVARPPAARLTELIRLALGLHQTLVVTLEDHRLNADDPRCVHGEGWNIEMIAPDQSIDVDLRPYRPSIESAAEYFLEYLENAIHAAVPTDLYQAIRVPQTPQPAPLVEDPVPLIRRLARHHAGDPVSIRYHHTGCHLYLHERDSVRHLATARTAEIALTAIGLGPF